MALILGNRIDITCVVLTPRVLNGAQLLSLHLGGVVPRAGLSIGLRAGIRCIICVLVPPRDWNSWGLLVIHDSFIVEKQLFRAGWLLLQSWFLQRYLCRIKLMSRTLEAVLAHGHERFTARFNYRIHFMHLLLFKCASCLKIRWTQKFAVRSLEWVWVTSIERTWGILEKVALLC